MKKFLPILVLLCIGMIETVPAQNVFSPQDENRSFPNPEPPIPPANTLAKWYRTDMGIWNTEKFKCYYWNGMAFRLRFPNNYNPNDPSVKYPLILAFHGGGEYGPVSDNDHQLQVGAQYFEQLIDQGKFNGFLLLPQLALPSGWDRSYYDRINSVLDSLQKYVNLNSDRVISIGISNGGYSALAYSMYYPTRSATVIGSSPALLQNFTDQDKNNLVHIPVWLGSGFFDVNPSPQEVQGFVTSFRGHGGNIRYSFFPALGHVMWYQQWAEPYFVPYLNNAHKADPLIYFQQRNFTNEASVNARLGISAGFAQYQWQKNGADIPGATSNEFTATSSGTYRVHFKRTLTDNWSEWSPHPAVISIDGGPAVNGLKYSYYEGEYYSVPDFSALTPTKTGTTDNFDIVVKDRNDLFAVRWDGNITITTPGTYTFETISDDGSKLYVNQPYSHAGPALVNNDNPHAATSVTANIDLAAGTYPITATFFENTGGELMQVYYSGPGIPRQLIPDNVLTLPSAGSTDGVSPGTPTGLRLLNASSNSLSLDWDDASDNVGVSGYNVYINGVKNMSASVSNAVINNLSPGITYAIKVQASDAAGNVSAFSAEISAATTNTSSNNGVKYSYYEGEFYAVPDFNTLAPAKTGTSANFDLGVRNRNDLFAIRWDANITITTAGRYTFETVSDDGSKLYVNQPYSYNGPALVNNDNPHAPASVSASIDLAVGTYPITATFFENTGGELMQVYYSGPGIERQLIPNNVLTIPSANVVANGLNYRFYQGTWDALPNFNTLTPVKTGTSANIDLGVRTAGVNDNFAFVWEGYFNAQLAGNYTFELISDDGSMMFLNSQYSPTAVPFIDNNNLHASTNVSKTVNLVPGLYPVCFTFFEATGNEQMQVYVTGPGIPRQLIPNVAFIGTTASSNANQVQTAGESNRNVATASPIAESAGSGSLNEAAGSNILPNAFPNPFRENLNIRYYNSAAGNKVRVEVCDVSGRVLFTRKFDNLPAGTSMLSLNSLTGQLSPGIYTLRLQVNGIPFKIWKVVKAKS